MCFAALNYYTLPSLKGRWIEAHAYRCVEWHRGSFLPRFQSGVSGADKESVLGRSRQVNPGLSVTAAKYGVSRSDDQLDSVNHGLDRLPGDENVCVCVCVCVLSLIHI